MTSFRVGSASDVGQLRSINQDSKLVAHAVPVFAVADGMGGHQGGEVASAIAVETLEAVISEPTIEAVVEAVKEANRRIFSRASDATELRGMGTTLVAIALVHPDTDDEEIVWVNVGDSRVYLLRDEELHQLSRDHSLVEDLRRGGQLSEEEAAIHPQRNILTRALGIDSEVEVDSDSLLPFTGDRFLLCSDGLFNEVDQPTIVATLVGFGDPDAAAEELVRLANEGGGRDNITCVIVDVTDDNGRSDRAVAAVAAAAAAPDDATVVDAAPLEGAPLEDVDGAPPGDPTPPAGLPVAPSAATVPAASDAVTEPVTDPPASADPAVGSPPPGPPALPVEGGPVADGDEDLPFGRGTTDLYGDLDHVGGRHKAVAALIAVVVLAVVLGGAYLGGSWWASRGYFVAASGEQVQIFKGQPGGFLIFDPELEEDVDTPLGDFTTIEQSEIRNERTFDSLADARSFVNTAEARARQRESTSTTSTTEATTTADPDAPTTEGPTTTAPGIGSGQSASSTTEGP